MAAVKICPICEESVITGSAFLVLGGEWSDGRFRADETEGVVCFDCYEAAKGRSKKGSVDPDAVKVEETPLVFVV